MRIGFTGHQNLSAATRRLVSRSVAAALVSAPHRDGELIGVTSLATGADQLCAFALLAAGGTLHAVIPSMEYEGSFAPGPAREAYLALCRLATETLTLPFAAPGEEAYMAAGRAVVDRCDQLIAVWDGRPAAGLGGTGDVVAYARDRGVEVHIVWPSGAERH